MDWWSSDSWKHDLFIISIVRFKPRKLSQSMVCINFFHFEETFRVLEIVLAATKPVLDACCLRFFAKSLYQWNATKFCRCDHKHLQFRVKLFYWKAFSERKWRNSSRNLLLLRDTHFSNFVIKPRHISGHFQNFFCKYTQFDIELNHFFLYK